MADVNWGIQSWAGFWGLDTSGTAAVGQDIGAIGTDRILKSVSVYVRFVISPSTVPRVAVYQGGVLDDPTGATLLYDAGTFPAVVGWQTVIVSGGPLIAQNTITWIVVKDTSINDTIYGSMLGPGAPWEDFNGMAGVRDNIGISNNPALPFESSIPGAGTLHSPANQSICCYLTHAEAPLSISLDRIKFLAV